MSRKHKQTLLIVLSVVVVAAVLCVRLWLSDRSDNPDGGAISYAPDGTPYGVPFHDTIYRPEHYDPEYGHFEDLVGLSFEHVKPDYYDGLDFSSVTFPIFVEDAVAFPHIVAKEAVRWRELPDDVMLSYFSDDEIEYWARYHQSLAEYAGFIPREPDPVYSDIEVRSDGPNFEVWFSTSNGAYVQYYELGEEGLLKEVRFDVPAE
jgi:hypothetical protein